MGFFSTLTRRQKESTVLLQAGTFLEYFDLMLYVHMAVFLNELFFPKATGFTASLLTSFAFCSTFVFRPFGAMLFGYIGDKIGRKHTVIITSTLMSFSCITMAVMPTYETVGITAAWVITLCRAIQGMSSMGEIVGAGIYLTETIPLPARHPVVAWLTVSASVGAMAALAIATMITTFSYEWRPVFFFGATIAVIGSVARTMLRETPEFLKNRKKQTDFIAEKTNYKTILGMFFVFCSGPVWFYFVFIYCGNILRDSFGYTAPQLLQNNFFASIAFVISNIICSQLCYRVYPIKIVKVLLGVLVPSIALFPYLLNHVTHAYEVLIIQTIVGLFSVGSFPSTAIFYRHFPTLKRMTLISMGYAVAKAFMYAFISFGMIYLNLWMGHWGLWVLMIPSVLTFAWALRHFEKLDAPYRHESSQAQKSKKIPDSLKEAA
ncbi:MAG: MFS transporter [Alphaproteobacteria bacterium]